MWKNNSWGEWRAYRSGRAERLELNFITPCRGASSPQVVPLVREGVQCFFGIGANAYQPPSEAYCLKTSWALVHEIKV